MSEIVEAHGLWDQWMMWGKHSPGLVVDEFAAITLRAENTLYGHLDESHEDADGGGMLPLEGWHRRGARLAAYAGASWNTDIGLAKDRGFCMDALAITLADVTIPEWMLERTADALYSAPELHRYALMPLQCLAAHPNSDRWTVEMACRKVIDYLDCEWWASGDNSGRHLWERHAYKTLGILLADEPQLLPLVSPGYLTRPDMISDEVRSRMLVMLATAEPLAFP